MRELEGGGGDARTVKEPLSSYPVRFMLISISPPRSHLHLSWRSFSLPSLR